MGAPAAQHVIDADHMHALETDTCAYARVSSRGRIVAPDALSCTLIDRLDSVAVDAPHARLLARAKRTVHRTKDMANDEGSCAGRTPVALRCRGSAPDGGHGVCASGSMSRARTLVAENGAATVRRTRVGRFVHERVAARLQAQPQRATYRHGRAERSASS